MIDLKMFDNKQLIHIASEIVILLGMTFYFSSKNKTLTKHIEDLSTQMEKQDDRIQKLETTVQQLSNVLGQVSQGLQQLGGNTALLSQRVNSLTGESSGVRKRNRKPAVKKTPVPPPVPPSPSVEKKLVHFDEEDDEDEHEKPVANEDELSEDLSDSDLDAEIQDELSELSETENQSKKKE